MSSLPIFPVLVVFLDCFRIHFLFLFEPVPVSSWKKPATLSGARFQVQRIINERWFNGGLTVVLKVALFWGSKSRCKLRCLFASAHPLGSLLVCLLLCTLSLCALNPLLPSSSALGPPAKLKKSILKRSHFKTVLTSSAISTLSPHLDIARDPFFSAVNEPIVLDFPKVFLLPGLFT